MLHKHGLMRVFCCVCGIRYNILRCHGSSTCVLPDGVIVELLYICLRCVFCVHNPGDALPLQIGCKVHASSQSVRHFHLTVGR